MNKKALVLLSGGQDSTTCLFWAIQHFQDVYAIGFDYGQRHAKELKLAAEIAESAKVSYYIATINTLSDISKNALVTDEIDVEEAVKDKLAPNTLVQGRNMLFLTYAAIYAKTIDAENIVMGVSQTDYSNYPDCRQVFIDAAEKALNLATESNFKIHTPLMYKTKAETWQLADNLGVLDIIRNKTLTCYNGITGEGCGNCPACKLRKKGWDEFMESRKK
jgi:7-cyano-7-deazaguanine synthase